jgi:hypothetical protein
MIKGKKNSNADKNSNGINITRQASFTREARQAGKYPLISTSIFLLFFLLNAADASAATYYIATTGSDSNPGTLSQPWRTIGKANSTLQAGDTVYIRAGTYNESISLMLSGNAGNYII